MLTLLQARLDEEVGAIRAEHGEVSEGDAVVRLDDEDGVFVEEGAAGDAKNVLEGATFDFGFEKEAGLKQGIIGRGIDLGDDADGATGAIHLALKADDVTFPSVSAAAHLGGELDLCSVVLGFLLDEGVVVERERQTNFVTLGRVKGGHERTGGDVGTQLGVGGLDAAIEGGFQRGPGKIALGLGDGVCCGGGSGGGAGELGLAGGEGVGLGARGDFLPIANGLIRTGLFLSECGLRVCEIGLRLSDGGLVVGGIEFEENLARLEPAPDLEFGTDAGDFSRDLGGEAARAGWLDEALGGDAEGNVDGLGCERFDGGQHALFFDLFGLGLEESEGLHGEDGTAEKAEADEDGEDGFHDLGVGEKSPPRARWRLTRFSSLMRRRVRSWLRAWSSRVCAPRTVRMSPSPCL